MRTLSHKLSSRLGFVVFNHLKLDRLPYEYFISRSDYALRNLPNGMPTHNYSGALGFLTRLGYKCPIELSTADLYTRLLIHVCLNWHSSNKLDHRGNPISYSHNNLGGMFVVGGFP